MEVSPIYGITNLIIVILFYVGLVFAGAWILNKKTRLFGLALVIAVLLVAQIHANTLYFLAFSNLPQGYNFAALAFALAFVVALLAMQYQQLRVSGIALFDKQFKKNFGKGVLITVGFTIGLAVLDRIF